MYQEEDNSGLSFSCIDILGINKEDSYSEFSSLNKRVKYSVDSQNKNIQINLFFF